MKYFSVDNEKNSKNYIKHNKTLKFHYAGTFIIYFRRLMFLITNYRTTEAFFVFALKI